MEEEKETVDRKSQRAFVAQLLVILLAFVGLAMPLVTTHGATYDPETWTFAELDSRFELGAGILFGVNSAIVWPSLVLYILVLVSAVLVVLGQRFEKIRQQLSAAAMILLLVSGVMFLLSNNFYGYCNAQATVGQFSSYFVDESSPSAYFDNHYWYISQYIATCDSRLGVGTIWSAACCFAGALVIFSLSMAKEETSVQEMTEIALFTAIAIGLDVLFHYIMPRIPGQVGSLSLALLPLYFVALRHGPVKAFLASSIVYGLITCLTDGYGFFLYPLDYFVAFGGVAVLGLFRNQIFGPDQKTYNLKGELFILLGVLLGGFVRLIGSGASSIINYGYTFLAALIANSLYIFVSAGACAAVLMGLYGPLLTINRRFPVRHGLNS